MLIRRTIFKCHQSSLLAMGHLQVCKGHFLTYHPSVHPSIQEIFQKQRIVYSKTFFSPRGAGTGYVVVMVTVGKHGAEGHFSQITLSSGPCKCQELHCGKETRWIKKSDIIYDPLVNKELQVKELSPKFDSIIH